MRGASQIETVKSYRDNWRYKIRFHFHTFDQRSQCWMSRFIIERVVIPQVQMFYLKLTYYFKHISWSILQNN